MIEIGWLLIVLAGLLGWKMSIRYVWILAIFSGIGLAKVSASAMFVVIAGVALLLYPLYVGSLRLVRKTWWDIRDNFTDRRVPMPPSVRKAAWKKWGRRCVYCGRKAEHLDHVKPYHWLEKHGRELHRIDNLRPACARCNMLVSGRVFGNLDEKRAWIQSRIGGMSYKESAWGRAFRYMR